MPKANDHLTTIRTEGSLLPPDLLARVSDEDTSLAGMTPASYHRSGERLNEAISRSWTTLQSAWSHFRAGLETLAPGDRGTTITRERWLLPLFRELDYGRLPTAQAATIDGKPYAISHSWGLNVPIHLVSYQVDLDKKTRGVPGAATHSPHSLLQVFLNRSDDHLWGFVSNGCKLRILRDNLTLTRQAYVEFDLEAMMDGDVYSDFRVLWLLCHQSRANAERPSDCWLEKWMKEAADRGTRALDHLRDGVQAAIEALGIGFLEHHANGDLRDKLCDGRLDKQNYYRQLLRIVYRLLFLFVAEDRDLLLDREAAESVRETYRNYYSTQRLRRMAARFVGTRHSDLFEALRLVMRLLGGVGDGSALGIVPLGSFLFSDRAVTDVIDCKISNRRLLSAIHSLSRIDDRETKGRRNVDYKNLGPEELGSVYESLLELHPHINVDARSFALETGGGNERKTSGSYYTPSSLINALLDSALDPVLNEAAKNGADAVLELKVCDPATGSGHFLIAAANRMAKRLASLRTGEEEPSLPALQEAKRDIIGRCIYGVDINPMAAELCKVSLWLEALEPGKPLSFLDHHIQVGNSLLGTTPRLMAGGIPNDAFKPIEGDDKQTASTLRKRNRQELKQREAGLRQLGLEQAPPADYGYLSDSMNLLAAAPGDSLADIREKEDFYAALAQDDEYVNARLMANAWCAAFVWEKRPGEGIPLTDLLYRHLEEDPQSPQFESLRQKVAALADHYGFFHWHIAFPDVFQVPDDLSRAGNEAAGWNGGFDVVLGNPPYSAALTKGERNFLKYTCNIGTSNTAAIFMMQALLLVRLGGLHGFVVPKSFLYSSRWALPRERLLDGIDSLYDCGKMWDEVNLEQIVYSHRNRVNVAQYLNWKRDGSQFTYVASVSKNVCRRFGFYANDLMEIEIDIANRMRQQRRFLGGFVNNTRGAGLQRQLNNSNYGRGVLAGTNVHRYQLNGVKGYFAEDELPEKASIETGSVLAQNILTYGAKPYPHIRINAHLVQDAENDFLILDTINQISVTSDNISPAFIVALLNSKLINWYAFRFIFAKAVMTMHFDNPVTDRIPFPSIEATYDSYQAVVVQVQEIYQSEASDRAECQRVIDSHMYRMFGLTPVEITTIESAMPSLEPPPADPRAAHKLDRPRQPVAR